jgi:S1-C subfamily serine protease
MLTAVLLSVLQLVEARWAVILACPVVSMPGVGNGTGVVVGVKDGFAYVLTAAHTAQSERIEVKFTSREHYPKAAWFGEGAVVIGRWPDPDFALVRFPIGKREVPILPVAPAWQRPKEFPVGGLSVGVGSGEASTALPELIEGKEFVRRPEKGPAFFWQTAEPPEPGRSGGPLLDSRGRVIGITVAFRGKVGYYAHHDEIVAALKREGFGWLIPPSP